MAGLDTRQASGFLSIMLKEVGKPEEHTTSADPVQLCTETIRTVQMASEALLLRDRDMPLSRQPFSGCCDTIVARRKILSIAATNAVACLKGNRPAELCKHLAAIAEQVSVITETTAQAVFMVAETTPGCKKATPSLFDPYLLTRARLAIELATDGFERANTTPAQAMSMAVVIATHLDILREQCTQAAERAEKSNPDSAILFKALGKSLSGNAGVLVASLKTFVKSGASAAARQECQIFTKPLLACIHALIEYSFADATFAGKPPVFKKEVADYIKPIQASALSVSSSTTLFVAAIKSSLANPADKSTPLLLARYFTALDDALNQMTTAIKATRDANFIKD